MNEFIQFPDFKIKYHMRHNLFMDSKLEEFFDIIQIKTILYS